MTSLSVTERVQLGATLLDTEFPGWTDHIDLKTLNLKCGCNCVLGQKFGDFSDGAREIGYALPSDAYDSNEVLWNDESSKMLEALGFFVRTRLSALRHDDYSSFEVEVLRVDAEYATLTEAWTDLILARRAESAIESELVSV